MTQDPRSADSLAKDLARLEQIVYELEGDVDLDRALSLFEEGVRHLKQAKERLNEAEARVQRVLEDASGALSLTDLDV
jgi:exodeoxyribonuclease VII small subunit